MAGGFGGIGTQRGMGGHAERSPRTREVRESSPQGASKAKPTRVMDQLPEVWALLKPRRGLLALGLVLMAVNRVSGLILPASQKYLFDNVFSKHQTKLLTPLVAAVLLATLIQGLTSYALTQLLSKAAQRMITDHSGVNKSATELVQKLHVTPEASPTSQSLQKGDEQNLTALKKLSGKGH